MPIGIRAELVEVILQSASHANWHPCWSLLKLFCNPPRMPIDIRVELVEVILQSIGYLHNYVFQKTKNIPRKLVLSTLIILFENVFCTLWRHIKTNGQVTRYWTAGIFISQFHKRRIYTEEKGKGKGRCFCLGERIYSISCHTSSFALGRFEE